MNTDIGGVMTVKESWAQFSKLVFGQRKPSDVQYQETRRAFYAGFQGALAASLEIAKLDEDTAIRKMEALQIEFVEFAKEMMAGRA
jgi:hypothetical protein